MCKVVSDVTIYFADFTRCAYPIVHQPPSQRCEPQSKEPSSLIEHYISFFSLIRAVARLLGHALGGALCLEVHM